MCDNGCGPIFPIEEVAEAVSEILLPDTKLDMEDIANACSDLNVRVEQVVSGRVISGVASLGDLAKEIATCLGLETRLTNIETKAEEHSRAIEELQEQAKSDIVSITTGADGILRYQLRDGTNTTLQIDTDQVTFQNTPEGVVFTNENGTSFTLTPAIIKGMIASDYVDTTELEDAISDVDLDQVISVTFTDGNLTITNEDGSTATLPSSVIISSLNEVLATDAELAAAIAAIPQVTVSAGDNVEVVKTGNDYQVNVPIIAFVDKCDVVSTGGIESIQLPFTVGGQIDEVTDDFVVSLDNMDKSVPLEFAFNFVQSPTFNLYVLGEDNSALLSETNTNNDGSPLGQFTYELDLSNYTGNSIEVTCIRYTENPNDTVFVNKTLLGETTSTPYLLRLKDGQPDGTFELDTTTPYTVQGTPTDPNCCGNDEETPEPITLSEGDNVTITQNGNDYQISADSVEFATTEEINTGQSALKAVSAAEYRKEVYVTNQGTNSPKIMVSSFLGFIDNESNIQRESITIGAYSNRWFNEGYTGRGTVSLGFEIGNLAPTQSNINNVILGNRAGSLAASENSVFLGYLSGGVSYSDIIASGKLDNIGSSTMVNTTTGTLTGLDLSSLSDGEVAVVFYTRAGDTLNNTQYVRTTGRRVGSELQLLGSSSRYSGYDINTGDPIDVYILPPNELGQYNNALGSNARLRMEDEHTVIGSPSHANVYTSATINCTGVLVTSDKRSKKVGDKVSTLPNGIEIYKFQYLNNGCHKVGWLAQQVEELLKGKGYDQEIIDMALPKTRDVDWTATIKNFNKRVRARVSTWPEAVKRFDKFLLEKARELGVTEPTVEDFILAVDEVQANYDIDLLYNTELETKEFEEGVEVPAPRKLIPVTDWQGMVYAELTSFSLDNYLVYADDIMGINKDLVRDLLA